MNIGGTFLEELWAVSVLQYNHATLDLLRNVTVTTMIDGPTTITLSATTPILRQKPTAV